MGASACLSGYVYLYNSTESVHLINPRGFKKNLNNSMMQNCCVVNVCNTTLFVQNPTFEIFFQYFILTAYYTSETKVLKLDGNFDANLWD